MTTHVTKRSGLREPLDIEKFHKVITWACEGVKNVSVSEIAIRSQIEFYDGITTDTIQETIIRAAAELISEDTPEYQYVAGRLISYTLRKKVYGKYEPDSLLDHYRKIAALGYYDRELESAYSAEEWEELNSYVKHDRDDLFTYAAMEQWRGKYLVKNRVTGQIFETPQIAYMLIAMTLFSSYERDRLTWVKDYYDAVSTFDLSLPTPVMAGVRTPQRQFSSCVLIETDDSLDSINASASSIVRYVSKKAGIGIGAGRIRAVGSPVADGSIVHTGVIPFLKYFHSAVKSCAQGGIRGGAATCYYPVWHLEAEELLVLKNNRGTEETRIRHMDYGVQFNKLMYERLIGASDKDYITLFSPSDVPGLYEAFFADQDEFKRLYELAESNPSIRQKRVPALDLFSSFIQERKDTGRVYLMNVDNVNDHSPFDPESAPIRMSNLCCEIGLPTVPLRGLDDPEGEIALCTLSAINWGNIKKPEDFRRPCELAVRGLDALLSYQDYMVPAAKNSVDRYRPLGIGIVNLAYWMAKNGISYSDPDLAKIDEYAEAWSYYLIRASVDLAKEMGQIGAPENSRYCRGILPIDTYKRSVDDLVPHDPKMDWESLREDLLAYGIRNNTLMAVMPAESSALISNSTNGIEPPRALVSVKQSKDGVLKQVVPGLRKLKNRYELLWDIKSPDGYIKICSVLQKYIDQAISVNTSYNPKHYGDDNIPMSALVKDILTFYKYGGKNLYYFNTNDGSGEINISEILPSAETAEDPEDCEGCKL